MRVVGLTGGVGSGKSAASLYFAQLGVPVVDTDEIARVEVAPGAPALAQIAATFGSHFITPAGELDRASLRGLVFADPAAKAQLEHILHPRILARSTEKLAALTKAHRYAVLVVPLLLEAPGFIDLIDRILVIDVPEAVQLARVAARPGLDDAMARRIIAQQASRVLRLQQADDILINDRDLDALKQAVAKLHAQYLAWTRDDET